MRRLLFIAIFAILAAGATAKTDSLQAFIQKANDFYKKNNYDSAIVYYQKVLDAGWEAPQLYYNLGNAYFRHGLLAKALVNYERAYRLDPSDENIRHNLEFARQFIQDNFNEVREFFLVRAWRSIALSLKADLWAYISIVLFALSLLFFFLYLFAKTLSWRKTGFFSAIIAMIFALLTFGLSLENRHYVQNSEEAIVLQPTSVRSSPSNQGTELYILHEGVKVKVLSTNDGWYEVKLPNGSIGWLPKSDVEKI
jgi:tetratricopeptide (TPR) repeat protein